MKRISVFGFGSLIGEESLRATAPNAQDIRPAYVKGFVRDFSLWDSAGFTERNFDLANIPFCALDIQKASNPEMRVNGVSFSVDEQEYERLLERERDYSVIETDIYDYESDELVGKAKVFSSGRNDGSFDFSSAAAMRYLEGYLEAAQRYGDRYYQEILETTFIDGQDLRYYSNLLTTLPTH